jgi:uncharacterized membrane protein YedE/YeeE
MIPALLIFGNKHFGISVSFKHICAACIPSKNPFFNYDWKKESWNLVLATGMLLGGFVAANHLTNKNEPIKLSEEAQTLFSEWNLNYGYSVSSDSVNHSEKAEIAKVSKERLFMPTEIFSFHSFSSTIGWIFIVIGGFFVGFGTRWANGCTSGHAIMGLSLLNPGSLVAVIGFFIGGLAVSWFVIPNLLSL